MTEGQSPAGWYPDPAGSGQQRYFDGSTWTENYAPLAPAPVPVKKGHGCLYSIIGVAVVVALAIVLLIAALGGAAKKVSDDLTKTSKEAAKEVKITSCAVDAVGDVEVDGTATNTSSGRSDYLIDLVVNDKSGTQLDSSTAVVNNVEPGQTAQWKGLTTAKYADGVVCKVASVLRHASFTQP